MKYVILALVLLSWSGASRVSAEELPPHCTVGYVGGPEFVTVIFADPTGSTPRDVALACRAIAEGGAWDVLPDSLAVQIPDVFTHACTVHFASGVVASVDYLLEDGGVNSKAKAYNICNLDPGSGARVDFS